MQQCAGEWEEELQHWRCGRSGEEQEERSAGRCAVEFTLSVIIRGKSKVI